MAEQGSQNGPMIVAQRIDSDAQRRRRTPDEEAMARSPAVYAAVGRRAAALSPSSKLRQRLLRRELISGWAAFNRRDFDLVMVRYAPEMIYEFSPDLVTLGLPARIEGREMWREEIEEYISIWAEQSQTLSFLIDLGEKVIGLGHGFYRGAASGIELEIGYAQLVEHSQGLGTHERDFSDWAEAIREAGLQPGVLERLERLAPGSTVELGGMVETGSEQPNQI